MERHSDPRADWDALLDMVERALETGEHVDLPANPPKLPQRLLSRARSIMERQRRATAELERQLAEVADELSARPSMHRPTRRASLPADGVARSL
jgi:hypothetical protein